MADPVAGLTRLSRINAAARPYFHEQRIYFMHVLGMFRPGVEIPVVRAHQITTASLEDWDKDDLERMIEEGRRQFDRQLSDLERIFSRAQWLFGIGAAVTVALGTALKTTRPTGAMLIVWVLALVVLGYGIGGAAAVMTVRGEFATIDTAKLSHSRRPMVKSLATSYSRMLGTGENTVATRVTVFRHAVLFVSVGGYLGLVIVVLAVLPHL